MESLDKHPGTIVQDQQPLNVESPLGPLRESFVTPTELFYMRSHGTIPEVDRLPTASWSAVWWSGS
jgi:sulfite oxidase